MFLKGLPAQYACVNPECSGRRVTEGEDLLGRIYSNPHTTCESCGSRVFELISHRTCGAAYLRAYRRSDDDRGPTFLWSDPESSEDLDELHLLVEEPQDDPNPDHEHGRSLAGRRPPRNLSIASGHLVDDRHVDDKGPTTHIEVQVPTEEPPDGTVHGVGLNVRRAESKNDAVRMATRRSKIWSPKVRSHSRTASARCSVSSRPTHSKRSSPTRGVRYCASLTVDRRRPA